MAAEFVLHVAKSSLLAKEELSISLEAVNRPIQALDDRYLL